MFENSPYALQGGQLAAADAAVEERAAFLRRTYSWLLGGIAVWCCTMYAVGTVAAVQELALGFARRPVLTMAFVIGGAMVVRATASRQLIGPVVYMLYAVAFGLMVGPMVMLANHVDPSGNIVSLASLTTGVIFVGLTGYVLVKGADFSFIGGALTIVCFALLAVLLGSWIFGYSVGIWFSVIAAVLYCGFILYDTSQILHHTPTNMHIAAAATMFSNVVLLFLQLLRIFMARDE